MENKAELAVEKTLFASRWLLAPIYLVLVVALVVIVVKFFEEAWHLVTHYETGTDVTFLFVGVLGLLDLALLANLVLIVILAGFENFVSKMRVAAESEDRPAWMGHVDFSGMKMKLIGSLIAISVIELLKDFVQADAAEISDNWLKWRIAIHAVFLVTGLVFAVMDYVADKRTIMVHGPASGHES